MIYISHIYICVYTYTYTDICGLQKHSQTLKGLANLHATQVIAIGPFGINFCSGTQQRRTCLAIRGMLDALCVCWLRLLF